MPTIKNKTLISLTKLFKISKLDIEFKENITREYEVISGTGNGAVMISWNIFLPKVVIIAGVQYHSI